jgi:hypothetical protein
VCHTNVIQRKKGTFIEQCGLQKNVEGVLEAFLLFSDQYLIILFLKPTAMLIIVLKVLPLNTGDT